MEQTFYGMLCLASHVKNQHAIGNPPLPHLHLNLWEPIDGQVFLDVGLLISRLFRFRYIHFYFPWRSVDDWVDLTSRISSAADIAVVFNENWSVNQVAGSSSVTVQNPVTKEALFQVISPKNHLKVDENNASSHRLTLDLETLAASGNAQPDKMYVRFRVRGVPKHFYAGDLTQGDRRLVSSWTKNEFIDFRLNVRRGAPPNLETGARRFVSFSKVHLFLMRHRSHELVFQDSAFKSCRSLEDESFWARYSHPKDDPGGDDLVRAKRYVANSLGYQWTKKESEKGSPVHEFGILARYKHLEVSVLTFVFAAVVIGAMGNALWSAIVAVWCKVTGC